MYYKIFDFVMALKKRFSAAARKKRARVFIDRMNIRGGEKIIDLGGTLEFWQDFPVPLKLTIVNLPGSGFSDAGASKHDVELVEGDACDVDIVGVNQFDIAFSNSVIEHVGDATKRAQMANEIERLAPRYWVQTPSKWFPIEAHCNMPFWWFYPEWLKQRLIGHWRITLPPWAEMVAGTTVLPKSEIRELFHGCTVWTEWKLGFPKSYVAYIGRETG